LLIASYKPEFTLLLLAVASQVKAFQILLPFRCVSASGALDNQFDYLFT